MAGHLAALILALAVGGDGQPATSQRDGDATARFLDRRMIFGSAARGPQGVGESWYGPAGYHTDNYGALQVLLPGEGFDAILFDVNATGDRAGVVDWPTAVPGFTPDRLADMERTLDAAEKAGLVVGVSIFTGGLANAAIAQEHPEWRQLDVFGEPRSYMGPLICWNTPYWESHLLPLYREFFGRYGERVQALVLWEGPDDACFAPGCQEALGRSGVSERADWEYKQRLAKWRELAEAIRAEGWQGVIVGGGWAGYEWEEERWDGTLYERECHRALPEREALGLRLINAIMPELYAHDLYGAHFARREDLHYVYRSLIYERSIMGPAIIPAVELHWRRSILPHELLRWLLECWSAGCRGVAVVSESKLYFERHHETQERFRGLYREILRRTARLPDPGLPRPTFALVVSAALERGLDRETVAMVGGWGPRCIIDGRTVRQSTPPDKSVLILSIPPGVDARLGLEVASPRPSEWSAYVDWFDGGSWQDVRVGDLSLPKAGCWESVTLGLSSSALAGARDAYPGPGRQVAIRFWPRGVQADVGTLILDGVSLTTHNSASTTELDVGGLSDEGVQQWYVAETCKLVQALNRRIAGGCVANERPEGNPADWDAVFAGIPQIAIVPRGQTAPRCRGEHVLHLSVAVGESLEPLADRITTYLRRHAERPIAAVSPLVAVNRHWGADGAEYLTVINHSNCPGRASVRGRSPEVLLSSDFIGRPVAPAAGDAGLQLELAPYGCAVLRSYARKG